MAEVPDYLGKYFFNGDYLRAYSISHGTMVMLPTGWQEILSNSEPRERVAAAAELWSKTLTENMSDVPRFLRRYCVDVALWIQEPVVPPRDALDASIVGANVEKLFGLVYEVRTDEGETYTYMGFDPRTADMDVIKSFPDQLRRFYTTVQDGFMEVNSPSVGFAATRLREQFSQLPNVQKFCSVGEDVGDDEHMIEVFASHNLMYFFIDTSKGLAGAGGPIWYAFDDCVRNVSSPEDKWGQFYAMINLSFGLTISRDPSL